MFRKKGIIYLSKTHLSLYYKDIVNPLRIDFDRNILENPSHKDKEWLQKNIKTLENKVKLRKLKAILILSKDLVFDKIIEDEDPDKRSLEINEFLAGLPIGVDLVEDKEFVKEGNVLVTATNKELYTSFVEVLKPLNIDVEYVIPEIVFNRVEFTKTFLDEVFRENILLRFGNFLEQPDKTPILDKKNILILISTIVISGCVIGGVFYSVNNSTIWKSIKNIKIEAIRTIDNSSEETIKEENTNNKTSESEQVTTEENNVEKINKEEITVSILNGTGIPGFAGKIGDLIKSIGYTTITTANASNFNYTNTIIELDSSLPLELVEEIRTVLKTELKSFEIKQTEDLGKKVIVITGEVIQK